MKFTIALSFVLAAIAGVGAVPAGPVGPVANDVFVPRILTPAAGTVWESFQRQNVTWDTSNVPSTISNRGFILLASDGREFPFILALDFDLRAGFVELTVPHVIAGSDYQIVLFGDSGNLSPKFTINSDFHF
ncbi:hypothetical protein C8J57DRAFT_1466028 [Mycena rebaudengoi]|nr:hypothetical protein C8J57DRAFT_1466028 [Mycena rebaudengoi]